TCPTGVTTHNPRLQKGLVPADKKVRVANYVRHITREVGIIAHACGVDDPRSLKPKHVRLINGPGESVSFETLKAAQREEA
ncbi:MAG: glutamate synthase-related protein, partial [Thiohalorhabdaceae bacterium]